MLHMFSVLGIGLGLLYSGVPSAARRRSRPPIRPRARAGRGVRRAFVEAGDICGDVVAGCLADALLIAVTA
jgi:hypothetical protein